MWNENVLSAILHLKCGSLSRARGRRAATSCVQPVNLLEIARSTVLGQEPQPWNGQLAIEAFRSRSRRRNTGVLGTRRLAQLHGICIHVEERCGSRGEVVVAADGQVGGRQRVAAEVEVEGDFGQHG